MSLDENGYVTASVPATIDRAVPTLGLAAHVDTYPGVSGAGVKPQVVRYEGGDLPLPGDPTQVLTPRELPALAEHVGHELVTSDGTTLLGADDKAGVAEIMAAAAYLVRHPELEHGPDPAAVQPRRGDGTRHRPARPRSSSGPMSPTPSTGRTAARSKPRRSAR